MMADWKRLKDMRTSQGFACTSCQLSVVDQGKNRKKKNKKMTSAAAAQDQHEQQQPPPPLDWDEEIERQMDESRRLFKEHVRSDSDRYNRQKAQWKLKKRTTTRSKKQRKVHHITQKKGGILWNFILFFFLLKFHQNMTKRSSSSSSESKEEEEKKDDEKSETDDDDDEPEAPVERQFDEEQTRAEILKVMEESLMPPGETMPNLSWTPNTTGNPPDVNDTR